MQNRLGPALLGLCLVLLPPAALAGDSLSTEDGVYTKAQAKNGKELYEVHCGTCHDNKYFRPVLKRWNGQSLSIFYDVMSMSMPESNPGSLLDAQYLDILYRRCASRPEYSILSRVRQRQGQGWR